MSGMDASASPAATVTFLCYAGGRVETDLWAGSANGSRAARNAHAIERLVRLAMTAPEPVREAIEAALDEAERQAGEDAP